MKVSLFISNEEIFLWRLRQDTTSVLTFRTQTFFDDNQKSLVPHRTIEHLMNFVFKLSRSESSEVVKFYYFATCIQAIEEIDVTYKPVRLKKSIQTRYPQLIFQPSETMNKGTLV